jgi:MarR family transcriptional regulator, organic hydroperoxide resistance regulator
MATSTSEPTAAEAATFAAAMEDFARAWRRARVRLRTDEGLSVAQYQLLEPLIDNAAPMSVGELAAQAGVAPPTATRMLDALVRDGVCERTRADDDRRCVKVTLTDAGRRAAQERRTQTARRRARIYAALTPAERRDATRLLERLAAAIEEL